MCRDIAAAPWCAACVFLILHAPGRAAGETARLPEPLTLERAVALALERSPTLRGAAAEVDIAAGRVVGARVLSPHNPEVSGGAGIRLGEGGPVPEAEAGLAQAFELGRPRSRRIAAARAARDAAEERREDARLRVAVEATVAWVNAVTAERLVTLAEQAEQLAHSLYQVAEDRGAADAATDLDVNLATIEWTAARRDLVWARRGRSEARLELARALALPPGENMVVPGTLPPCPLVTTPVAELIVRARAARRDLAALRREVEGADEELAVARAEAWPDLEVSARYSYEDGRDHIVAMGLAIPLPVFERNQGEVARARAATDLARVEAELAGLAVEHEVASAHAAFQAAAESAALFDRGVVERVERNLELLELSLEEGSVGIVEVLLVQRGLLSTRREALESEAAVHRARALLELVVGEEVQ